MGESRASLVFGISCIRRRECATVVVYRPMSDLGAQHNVPPTLHHRNVQDMHLTHRSPYISKRGMEPTTGSHEKKKRRATIAPGPEAAYFSERTNAAGVVRSQAKPPISLVFRNVRRGGGAEYATVGPLICSRTVLHLLTPHLLILTENTTKELRTCGWMHPYDC